MNEQAREIPQGTQTSSVWPPLTGRERGIVRKGLEKFLDHLEQLQQRDRWNTVLRPWVMLVLGFVIGVVISFFSLAFVK